MRCRCSTLVLCLTLAAILPIGLALAAGPNQRDVEPQPNVLDTDDITKPDSTVWVLNFRFKDPRLVMVNIPGRGCRVCLYMWYQVINNTNEPHLFIPDFELVTHDKNSVHHDHILPTAQEVISRIERDNIGTPIKNSVTIFAEPIPPQKPLAIERSVTGVAIWDDVRSGVEPLQHFRKRPVEWFSGDRSDPSQQGGGDSPQDAPA